MEPVIKWIKKNIFWLGCAFLAMVMVGMWFVASSSIADQTDTFESAVTGNMAKVKGILSVTAADLEEGVIAHPNATSEEGMKKELSKTIDAIVEAWTIRKRDQEKILVWPKVIPNERFTKVFGQFNPAETFPKEWEGGYGFESLLELYRSKIPEQMIYLCGDDVLRANWKYDPENMAKDSDSSRFENFSGFGMEGDEYDGLGIGGRSGGADLWYDENEFAVIWSDLNQDLWYQKMTVFQGRDDNNRETSAPTPLQCYMLQQDLWLLEAMFQIIRGVNGNSNANDLSVIKQIDHVLFGREVGGSLGELMPPDQRLAGVSDEITDPKADENGNDKKMMFEKKKMGNDYIGERGMGAIVSRVPYDERYVDLNFEPLSAEIVRSVITATELPENNLELIVAKRVPVRIALRMDERRIADFMAACANSPFAFEIQQVRWNKHTPGGDAVPLGGSTQTSRGMRGGLARSGGLASSAMNMGARGGVGGMGFAAMTEAEPVETRTNFDVNVEFYGIVKIYNPVREGFLRRAAGLEEEILDPGEAADAGRAKSSGTSSSTSP